MTGRRTTDLDDLSTRPVQDLLAVQRTRSRLLAVAVGASALGALLAALPFGWALAVPATSLLVGGLFAMPVCAHLLLAVRRELRRRGDAAS